MAVIRNLKGINNLNNHRNYKKRNSGLFSASVLSTHIISKANSLTLLLILILSLGLCGIAVADVKEAYEHEYSIMDKFHDSFDVYTNQDEGGNHFYPSGWMGDLASISFDSNWTTDCHKGSSCIKNTFKRNDNNWAALYWQESGNNWGTIPNGGYDITGATELTFWAKGENGGESVEFFAGGITGSYPDSLPKTSTGYITLTNSWEKHTISLNSKDLSHVIGGFGWATNSSNNPNGATFYLDEIKYNKARPDELRFLVSYETLSSVEPDRYIRNASFIYDNALALLTFSARGKDDDLRRAKILADSFVYSQNNDRYYNDGRLRNAYMSGDLMDHMTHKTRLSGWWDPIDNRWYEDRYQVSTYTGNLAWVMIALLDYYKKKGGSQYLMAAENLGEWIERETRDERGSGGYTGGYEGWEPNPKKITWKSTEHNIDIYVGFMLLYEVTDNAKWQDRALYARNFVAAMWNASDNHFWTGTVDDGFTINNGNIPLDIQAWALMALDNYKSALIWAENNCYVEADVFKGFDFNNDKDGVWFEGTAQMSVAYQINNDLNKSNLYISELQNAQIAATNANGKGIVAASHDGVTTGFDWEYFSRLHIGATAWYIFAEMGYNPYWGRNTKTLFEEYDPAIIYSGAWNNYQCFSCSSGSLKYTNQVGAKAQFSFNGTGGKWIVAKAKNLGKAKVTLDGNYLGLVDLYSPTVQLQVPLQKTGLAPGTHTVILEVSGQKNANSTDYIIDIDAFEVIP